MYAVRLVPFECSIYFDFVYTFSFIFQFTIYAFSRKHASVRESLVLADSVFKKIVTEGIFCDFLQFFKLLKKLCFFLKI